MPKYTKTSLSGETTTVANVFQYLQNLPQKNVSSTQTTAQPAPTATLPHYAHKQLNAAMSAFILTYIRELGSEMMTRIPKKNALIKPAAATLLLLFSVWIRSMLLGYSLFASAATESMLLLSDWSKCKGLSVAMTLLLSAPTVLAAFETTQDNLPDHVSMMLFMYRASTEIFTATLGMNAAKTSMRYLEQSRFLSLANTKPKKHDAMITGAKHALHQKK